MENIYENLLRILKQYDGLSAENGSLYKNKVQELCLKNDEKLIELLLSDPKCKEHFFSQVGNATIFNKDELIKLVYSKKFLPDSYTKFSEKIGLANEDEFIVKNQEVVLNWPYKDCILEGGMTKEEKGRDEIFWNEVIAPEHITRLKSPKAFMNGKRIDAKGTKQLKDFRRGQDGTIKDNLIIKGNNLLVLYSLKEQFAGKVKLIYIDPPYNIEGDSFRYNDKFNHSSWLTFIKNRLKASRELLSQDGFISVHCDDTEHSYLKVLMDEVFGVDNFIATFVRKVSSSARLDAEQVSVETDYICCYSKTEAGLLNYRSYKTNGYKKSDQHEKVRGKFKLNKLDRGSIKYSEKQDYPIKVPDGTLVYPGGTSNNNGWTWRWSEPKLKWGIANDFIVFKKFKDKWSVYFKQYENVNNKLEAIDRVLPYKNLLLEHYNEQGTKEHKELFGSKKFNYPKPESLMHTILSMATSPGDIVLDFFLGSGTTAAVAHKMGRQYIGVEQMDYVDDIACERLKKVVKGEQGGVSKIVEFGGGGNFVYLELAEWNQKWVKEIKQAQTKRETKGLWGKLKKNAFLSYKIDVQEVDKNAKEFDDLSLDDQKKFLLDCLDANHLYINFSEIEDQDYAMKPEDKELSRSFYRK